MRYKLPRLSATTVSEHASVSVYYNPKVSLDELDSIFHEFAHYPLYGTILADTNDLDAAEFMENYRTEIDEITGEECSFIYFRDIDIAKGLAAFRFSEHAKYSYALARLLGVHFMKLPCLLFFEKIDQGQVICISLIGLSSQEIMILMREIFDYLNKSNKSSPLNRLKKFNRSRTMNVKKRAMVENAIQMGEETFIGVLKSLILGLIK